MYPKRPVSNDDGRGDEGRDRKFFVRSNQGLSILEMLVRRNHEDQSDVYSVETQSTNREYEGIYPGTHSVSYSLP